VAKGTKRSGVSYEKVGITLPEGVYAEMIGIIEADKRWFDRVEFIREAVREKIERWRKDHPMWSAPAKDRSKER
jgi:metal-responsive CopG/Arc/MetJ family transcriptional regulator